MSGGEEDEEGQVLEGVVGGAGPELLPILPTPSGLDTSFGACSQQVDHVQVRPQVTHDLQL